MVISHVYVDIERPLAEIYAYLMIPQNHLLWQSGLLSIRGTKGMPVGSQLVIESVNLGQRFDIRALITFNDGLLEYHARSIRGPITFESSYRLRPLSPMATRLVVTSRIDTHVIFRLAEPVLQSLTDTKLEADLQALKLLLEARAD